MSEHHPPLDDDSNLVQDLNVEKQQLELTQLLIGNGNSDVDFT